MALKQNKKFDTPVRGRGLPFRRMNMISLLFYEILRPLASADALDDLKIIIDYGSTFGAELSIKNTCPALFVYPTPGKRHRQKMPTAANTFY